MQFTEDESRNLSISLDRCTVPRILNLGYLLRYTLENASCFSMVANPQHDVLSQLRPAYGMRASPTKMKELIKEVLKESLSGQTYQVSVISVTHRSIMIGRPSPTADQAYCRYGQRQIER